MALVCNECLSRPVEFFMTPLGYRHGIVPAKTTALEEAIDVRFGSKADKPS